MKFSGIVQKSLGEGARIGFPTANIRLTDKELSGIFAAEVTMEGRQYPAAAYADQRRGLLEAHLLDFAGDLYGREIEVQLLKKIRDDASFETEDQLKAAIAADVQAVIEYFKIM
jgi:riboflavin kinase / FMN adenylyltransferase